MFGVFLLRQSYNDLSRGHPKWFFCKGIPPKMPGKNLVKDLLSFAQGLCWGLAVVLFMFVGFGCDLSKA